MNSDNHDENSVLKLLLMLYPETPAEGQTLTQCLDEFDDKEQTSTKLDYVSENMIRVFQDSKEENKESVLYVLISRIKELYCRYEQYERVVEIEKLWTNEVFDKFIQEIYEITKGDIPLIISEAYARFRINNTIDEQIYNIIKKLYENGIYELFQSPFEIQVDEDKTIYIGYEEKNTVPILIEVGKRLSSDNEIEILERVVLSVSKIIYKCNEYEFDSKNSKQLYKTILEQFTEIEDICKDTHKFINKLIKFYITILKIASFNAEQDEFIEDNEIAQDAKKAFVEFINSVDNNIMNKYWDYIKSTVTIFMDCKYDFNEESKNIFLQTIIEFLNKNSISRLKRKMMEELIFNIYNISELFSMKEYKYVIQIYESHKSKENINLTRFYFEIAYSFANQGRSDEARQLYENIIDSGDENSAVYNNLGVIYEKKDKDYKKALQYYEKSVELSADNEIAINNIKRIKALIKELEEKPQKMKDMYFKKIKTWHRKILFAIYRLSDNDEITLNDLSNITKQSIDNSEKNLDYLIDLGMVVKNKSSFYLDSTIEELVRDYIDPKLEREIVKVDNAKLYRPIFYHESEIFMYKALLELFPQHLIFPNMSLKTIFDIDKMKELLDAEELKYLFMAHVDFVIINTSNYFPVLAFEKDSSYNDTEYASDRTEKKNLIFRTGGIPLIRLRFNSGIEYEKLKSDIRESTKSMILEYAQDNIYEVDFKKEFDVKRFGIVSSPIDLEIIKNDWEAIVGKAIYQKSKVIDVENGKLMIEISEELKPIIEMSEAVIKQKLFDKYEFLKEVEFEWY